MTSERIKFFEDLLEKPMAQPHRGWIEELLDAVKGTARPKSDSKPTARPPFQPEKPKPEE